MFETQFKRDKGALYPLLVCYGARAVDINLEGHLDQSPCVCVGGKVEKNQANTDSKLFLVFPNTILPPVFYSSYVLLDYVAFPSLQWLLSITLMFLRQAQLDLHLNNRKYQFKYSRSLKESHQLVGPSFPMSTVGKLPRGPQA